MTKRKHHYVWQYYLKAWATDGQVWCAMQGRLFRATTLSVGQQRDFYRLQELSPTDIKVVEHLFIDNAHPVLAATSRGWIEPFQFIFNAKRHLHRLGYRPPELDRELDRFINDTEEDLHSRVEGESVRLLQLLRGGDLSFWASDKDCSQLLFFLCLQYMRTPKMRDGILAVVPPALPFNAAAAMGLMRLISATNISGSLYFERGTVRLSLLRAPAGSSFITTNQPVVNSKAYGITAGKAPEELEFFYPVSPQYALVLTPRSEQPGTAVVDTSEAEVSRLNAMMVAMSREQVYAAAEIDLAALGLGVGAPASEPK